MEIQDHDKSAVLSAPGNQEFTFVIEWDDSVALRAADAGTTRQEKRAVMRSVMDDLKAPLLDDLRGHAAVSINDIAGSGHAVAVASAATWRSLFDSASLETANVRLNPNEPYHTL